MAQKKFDALLTKFVVNGMRPLSIVDDQDFVNLFEGKWITLYITNYITINNLKFCYSVLFYYRNGLWS